MKSSIVPLRFVLVLALPTAACGDSRSEAATSAKAEPAPSGPAPRSAGEVGDDSEARSPGEPSGVAKVVADAKADADPVDSPRVMPVDLDALYWAQGRDGQGRSLIDITDVPGPEDETHLVAQLAWNYEEQLDEGNPLPPDAALPPGFAIGDPWIIAGVDGEHRGKALHFEASVGPAELHLLATIDVEATGLAARADAWRGPAPRLLPVTPLDTDRGPGKALLEAIRPGLVAACMPDARSAIAGKRIESRQVQVVAGSFPSGWTHLVAMEVILQPREVGASHVAGLLFADATGRVESVFQPELTLETHRIQHLVDLQGDGRHEAVVESMYFEGAYTYLLSWDAAAKLTRRTLTGDGA